MISSLLNLSVRKVSTHLINFILKFLMMYYDLYMFNKSDAWEWDTSSEEIEESFYIKQIISVSVATNKFFSFSNNKSR